MSSSMKARTSQPIRWGVVAMATVWMFVILPLSAAAAPYAAMVIDARSGKVLHARNADTRLHPASLTKMMTLYVVFEAIENGEISLDTKVRISKHAASEPPSKLGLKAGQRISLRYLVRAAAVKSANDAATALAEAIEGSEARFARRMNRTAKALGMTRTTFKNAHGLTESGHLSTARDMTLLGRHLFYDYPQYYNLFSRMTADAGVKKVYHTNRKLLASYRGADGIKTGYTRAAGFNLVASAERGNERIIATVFGGRSVSTRNARVAELLDLGFKRAPSRAGINRPVKPTYYGKINTDSANETIKTASTGNASTGNTSKGASGKTVRLSAAAAVKKSLRPNARPAPAAKTVIAARADGGADVDKAGIDKAIVAAHGVDLTQETKASAADAATIKMVKPAARPQQLVALNTPKPAPAQEVVTRVSTSGGRHWGINIGRFPSEYKARKVLLKTALNEMTTLDGSLRKVVARSNGYDANFMGMTRETADLACRRLQAKQVTCFMIGPS